VLTAVALCAGVGQVVGSPPSDSQAVILGEVNAYEYDAVDGVRPPPIPLAISLTAINPNDRTLSMAATVEYTGQPRHTGQPGRRNFGWPPQYVDFPSFEPIIDPVKGVLKEKYKKLEAGLTFSSASGAEVDMKVPLGELLGFYTPTTRPVTRAVTIPVDSIPQSFPNDSYELGLRVEVNLPENILFFRDRDQEVFDVIDHLYNDGNFFDPVVFGVTKDSRLTQWTLDLDGNVPGTRLASNSSSDSANMQITLSRPWWYWTFIYSVSLMPALIGLSFFVRMRRHSTSNAPEASGAMELAAALIALLALRQVFVPADIAGLTRLDVILGIQLLVVCFLMADAYVRDAKPSRPAESESRRDTDPSTKI
jgi:hypothetical protein